MSEWCGPTAELPNPALAALVHRTRRSTFTAAEKKKKTDASAPLADPWFEDSQPLPAPEIDPSKPIEIQRERKERMSIPKVTSGPTVYPVYRSASTMTRVVLGLGVIGGAIAAAFTLL